MELDLVLPPQFAEACGYYGHARYVALRWAPDLLELRWSDDGHAVVGEVDAFLTLCSHPATEAALEPFHRANSMQSFRPWLLVDRDRRRLSFGTAAAVWKVLDEHRAASGRIGQRARHLREQRRLKLQMGAWLDWMSGRRGRGPRR